MTRGLSQLGTALFLLSLAATAAGAHGGSEQRALLFDEARALAYSQSAVGGAVGDYRFTTPRGGPVGLADYRGKPLVVNLVYTSCVHTCPLTVQTLRRAVKSAQAALGVDSFAVVTIGFDTRNDTPQRMRAYARAQGVDVRNWDFLSTDAATIDALARDLGFLFAASPEGFDHLAQTSIVDGEGRLYRQVYGADFLVPAVVEPLKDLVFGRRSPFSSLSGLLGRVRFLCTVYDPAAERYRFSYAIFIGLLIGAGSLSAVGVFLVRSWRQHA